MDLKKLTSYRLNRKIALLIKYLFWYLLQDIQRCIISAIDVPMPPVQSDMLMGTG